MRIVAGTLRGRRFEAPTGTATRPTSDRVREALFGALDSAGGCAGAVVLDAFSGSGALAFEALSRGAERATLVDNSRAALGVVRANLTALGLLDRATVLNADVFRLAKRGVPGGPFSLLFLDPPYKLDQSEVRALLESLIRRESLTGNAVVVWEHAATSAPDWPPGLLPVREKRYGDTTVSTAVREGTGEVA